jgi:ribosomal 30S subunit maturation factor RimM
VRTWCDVARVAATKKLDGGLVVKRTAGFPFFLDDAMSALQAAGAVFYVAPPATDVPRELHLAHFAPDVSDADSVYVRFEELDSIDAAQKLVCSHLLVDASALSDAGLNACALDTSAVGVGFDGEGEPCELIGAFDAAAQSNPASRAQSAADALFAIPPDAFVGYTFTDTTSGLRGEVADAQNACDQLLLTVNIDGDEHLVPAAPDLVQALDHASRAIAIECARGLFDL